MFRENAKNIHEKLLKENDPDVWERISHFTFEEVQDDVDLPNKTKLLSNLVCLLGMQGLEEFCLMFPVALANVVSPIEAKEVVYQAIDYLGLGRVMPFFKVMNNILLERGVKLSLSRQATTTMDNRLEKGEETQMRLFGPQMKDFSKKELLIDG